MSGGRSSCRMEKWAGPRKGPSTGRFILWGQSRSRCKRDLLELPQELQDRLIERFCMRLVRDVPCPEDFAARFG
jgi:hypothetical protein